MKLLIFTLSLIRTAMIFDFNSSCDISSWFVTNDDVMGGISNSSIKINDEGRGVFSGTVSVENNGGFAMIRHRKYVNCKTIKKVKLRVKGDGKNYQLRIKSEVTNKFWYVKSFMTSGKWEVISLDLNNFHPSFRGIRLDRSNFNSDTFNEFAILIGNKKTENFELLIDYIKME